MTPISPLAPDNPSSARYALALADDGVIDISIAGVWTREQVDAFFGLLPPLHHAARQRHGRVLHLIGVSTVQSPNVAARVRDRALALKRPGDRNAVVVATFLSKLQIQRLASNRDFGLYTDPAAARAWLTQRSAIAA